MILIQEWKKLGLKDSGNKKEDSAMKNNKNAKQQTNDNMETESVNSNEDNKPGSLPSTRRNSRSDLKPGSLPKNVDEYFGLEIDLTDESNSEVDSIDEKLISELKTVKRVVPKQYYDDKSRKKEL